MLNDHQIFMQYYTFYHKFRLVSYLLTELTYWRLFHILFVTLYVSPAPCSSMRLTTLWNRFRCHCLFGSLTSKARGYAYAKIEYVSMFQKIEYAYDTLRSVRSNSNTYVQSFNYLFTPMQVSRK